MLKVAVISAATTSLLFLFVTAVLIVDIHWENPEIVSGALHTVCVALFPVVWIMQMGGLIALGYILYRRHKAQAGPLRRIAAALDKMSKGDLGWKITLRQGDALVEMADSVTHASQTLAQRIGRMQGEIHELSEVENYLIDALDTASHDHPSTMKALRKLKICTCRLQADLDEFHLSSAPSVQRPSQASEILSTK